MRTVVLGCTSVGQSLAGMFPARLLVRVRGDALQSRDQLTVRAAVLGEWAAWQRTYGPEQVSYPLTPAITRMLDWLIWHGPGMAQAHMQEIIGDAEGDLGIVPATAGQPCSPLWP